MKRRGFTLIELLVVISMITLLASILILALRNARQQARALGCSSHIKQLALDMIMYENSNDTFPYGFSFRPFVAPPGGYPDMALKDNLGWWWFNLLKKHSNTKEALLNCPAKSIAGGRYKRSILYGNYGVNRSICTTGEFGGKPLGRSELSNPGQALLIVDSGYSIIGWWHATDVPPAPLGDSGEDMAYIPGLKTNTDRNLLKELKQDAVKGRHPGKRVNIGFADGHAGREKAEELFVEKSDEDYKNRTPLWLSK